MLFLKIDSRKAELFGLQRNMSLFVEDLNWTKFHICLCSTVTSKRIEQFSPGWSQIDALEKLFPDLMLFLKIDSWKAELLELQRNMSLFVEDLNWTKFHTCLCSTVTSKQIKQFSPGWSQIDALEKIFPKLM